MMTDGLERKWYPLRLYFSSVPRILKAQEAFEHAGIETFVPMTYQNVRQEGKEHRRLQPAFTNMIFVKSFIEEISPQIVDSPDYFAPIRNASFIFRRQAVYHDMDKIIDIPEKQMTNFMNTVQGNEEYIIYLKPDDVAGKGARPVVVSGGRFNNVRGELIRIDKNRHVVVRLEDYLLAAVTYIPLSNLRFVTDDQ